MSIKAAMQAISNIGRSEKELSAALFVYPIADGMWRGFVRPYDITIEAPSKREAIAALKEMTETYEDMLKMHGTPGHLAVKPFSNTDDSNQFDRIALSALAERGKVNTKDFYAEAIPA